MKNIIVTILTGFILASCQEPASQKDQAASQNTTSSNSNDDSLLLKAQNFFKVLPVVAEKNGLIITPEKISLGKRLFYDTHLSKTGKNSCNSCHNLSTYGVDNKATSTGDAGKNGERNSPTVLNAALHGMQFWDGRAKDVEEQAGMPILNPVEMAIPHKDFLVSRLKGIAEYKELFAIAFPGDKNPVSYDHLQQAIGAFERTLMTPSRFDQFLQGDVASLSADEKSGLMIFMETGCTNCHNGAVIGGNMLQKFGVAENYRTFTGSKTNDEGLKNITRQESDKDIFKVASLRNIAKTFPYFHDGSVAELNEAVKVMAKVQLNKTLSDDQLKLVVTFLNSLTGEVPSDAMKNPIASVN
ncbi:MAG: c-type cytochrome [Bacteroidetes bacterium]|nr:c-type cytochrome [Bacteroidota bacterium]